ncbi:MAG: hypothetical protein WA847_17085, partial [Terriglobales bacterium]
HKHESSSNSHQSVFIKLKLFSVANGGDSSPPAESDLVAQKAIDSSSHCPNNLRIDHVGAPITAPAIDTVTAAQFTENRPGLISLQLDGPVWSNLVILYPNPSSSNSGGSMGFCLILSAITNGSGGTTWFSKILCNPSFWPTGSERV